VGDINFLFFPGGRTRWLRKGVAPIHRNVGVADFSLRGVADFSLRGVADFSLRGVADFSLRLGVADFSLRLGVADFSLRYVSFCSLWR